MASKSIPFERVLCVCKGNSDRSPAMAAVLQMFLNRTRFETYVLVYSAGIYDVAKQGSASPFAVTAAHRIGLDLSNHQRRQFVKDDIEKYDLFIVAEGAVAERLVELGVSTEKIYNVQITNPWPVQFQEEYDTTFTAIIPAMYRVIVRFFSPSTEKTSD